MGSRGVRISWNMMIASTPKRLGRSDIRIESPHHEKHLPKTAHLPHGDDDIQDRSGLLGASTRQVLSQPVAD